MTARQTALKIHLWIGLPLGILVFLICITGCLWALKLNGWVGTPSLPPAERSRSVLLPSQALQAARHTAGSLPIKSVSYAEDTPIEVAFAGKQGETKVLLAPHSGKVLRTVEPEDEWFWKFVGAGHYSLWLPVEWGRPIVGYATLGFFLTLLSGLVLWYPRSKKARKAAWTFQWRKSTRLPRKIYDLHNVAGFYITPLLLIVAATGMVWGIDWWGKGVYRLTSGGKEEIPWQVAQSDTASRHAQAAMSHPEKAQAALLRGVDSIYLQIRAKQPEMTALYISLPDPAQAASALMITAQPHRLMYYRADRFSFDRYTLRPIRMEGAYQGRYADKDFAERLRRMNYEIHVGGIAGQAGRILVFLASLMGATLPISGLYLYIQKRRKKKKQPKE